MPLVILLELTESTDTVLLQAVGEEPEPAAVHRVHAASADPDAPADPTGTTLCGEDTAAMLTTGWQPTAPGERWPPRWRGWICPTCDTALRNASG
ncbi:hypothetical protein ABT095_29525 [Kitasatospora sp. NPDC002227]|uniref:hypothetical protein n=1 Tax=Kitasatospora sp. NPDC002227 TaxID=3154773 RepID=UPI00331AFCCF